MPTKKPDTAEAIVMEIGRRHYTAVLEDYYEGPFHWWRCWFCGTRSMRMHNVRHIGTCTYRRARAWVRANAKPTTIAMLCLWWLASGLTTWMACYPETQPKPQTNMAWSGELVRPVKAGCEGANACELYWCPQHPCPLPDMGAQADAGANEDDDY